MYKRKKALHSKSFCLAAQFALYRIHIRRRVRVACLAGFFDLRQSVKKLVFDRLWARMIFIRALLFIFHFQQRGIPA